VLEQAHTYRLPHASTFPHCVLVCSSSGMSCWQYWERKDCSHAFLWPCHSVCAVPCKGAACAGARSLVLEVRRRKLS
jgi:hypothetical protein